MNNWRKQTKQEKKVTLKQYFSVWWWCNAKIVGGRISQNIWCRSADGICVERKIGMINVQMLNVCSKHFASKTNQAKRGSRGWENAEDFFLQWRKLTGVLKVIFYGKQIEICCNTFFSSLWKNWKLFLKLLNLQLDPLTCEQILIFIKHLKASAFMWFFQHVLGEFLQRQRVLVYDFICLCKRH